MQIRTIALAVLCSSALLAHAATGVGPFENSQWEKPAGYIGRTFTMSHAYPTAASAPAMPWREAINNGPITTANAPAYTEALKAAIGDDMRVLLQDYEHWDADARGWYNEPWMGKTSVVAKMAGMREPLRGLYSGSPGMSGALFKASGLKKDFNTYVLVYYDKTAAVTLNNIWGESALTPTLNPQSTQFAEGSVIVKAAFITAGPNDWPVMRGTLAWPGYISDPLVPKGTPPDPKLTQTYLMQFDIIVKDSVAAPKTGWVFSTLVYDARVPSPDNDIWKKMVVLGAQWGNDSQANNPAVPFPVLMENWSNPIAPAYGNATLGWGQRLSGPNDGAMNDVGMSKTVASTPVKYVKNAKDSSCMSCHSSSQWDTDNPKIGSPSFLLPSYTPGFAAPPSCVKTLKDPHPSCKGFLGSPTAGSLAWMKWFKNRQGYQPMDPRPGVVAGDFDMVLTFKSLPSWFTETQNLGEHPLLGADKSGRSLQLRLH